MKLLERLYGWLCRIMLGVDPMHMDDGCEYLKPRSKAELLKEDGASCCDCSDDVDWDNDDYNEGSTFEGDIQTLADFRKRLDEIHIDDLKDMLCSLASGLRFDEEGDLDDSSSIAAQSAADYVEFACKVFKARSLLS